MNGPSNRSANHLFAVLAALAAFLVVMFAAATPASAAGTFRLATTEANEISGAWRVRVTIGLPKAPAIAHVPLRFVFTKTAEYERTLVDGKTDPVFNRITLANQNPTVESLDVDFADGTGKVFKDTRFDFALTRARGYVAGEYKVQVRTGDGVDIGTATNITLKGDNDVVDRRSMTFNAKDPKIKKVDDGSAKPAAAASNDVAAAAVGNGEVTATGSAAPFIPESAYEKTEEENIKVRKGGCGCRVETVGASKHIAALLAVAGFALVMLRRRTRKSCGTVV
jgi:MYXO-CTERM domain-containing protein